MANGNEGGRLSGGVDGPDFVEHGSDMVDSLRSLDKGRV
jgi:hypothetical protein